MSVTEPELPAMVRFQEAWQLMSQALEAVFEEGIAPEDALAAVGIEVPPMIAPMLAQMFAPVAEDASPLAPG